MVVVLSEPPSPYRLPEGVVSAVSLGLWTRRARGSQSPFPAGPETGCARPSRGVLWAHGGRTPSGVLKILSPRTEKGSL